MNLENQIETKASCSDVEPFYEVDENEAQDINSCLNFLSILDDEDSIESSDFTLFRKKEDKQGLSENKESVVFNSNCKNINTSNEGEVSEASSSKEEPCIKTAISSNNSTLNLNAKIISPTVFKIGNRPNILVPMSKKYSSAIRTKNNIILKIPTLPKKKNVTGDISLQTENLNTSHNINCKETKKFKNSKPKTISPIKSNSFNSTENLKDNSEYANDNNKNWKSLLPSVSVSRNPIISSSKKYTNKLSNISSDVKNIPIIEEKLETKERNSVNESNLLNNSITSQSTIDEKQTFSLKESSDVLPSKKQNLNNSIKCESTNSLSEIPTSTASCKNSIKIPESDSVKLVNFFNIFSSIEIAEHIPQKSQKEILKPEKNVKRKLISDSKKQDKSKKSREKKSENKIRKSKILESKEMYKPLERMELPTFLNPTNSQDKKNHFTENNEVNIESDSSSSQKWKSDSIKDTKKFEEPLVIDGTSNESSVSHSDQTSDSLIILSGNLDNSSYKSSSSEIVDKLHNYCHNLTTHQNTITSLNKDNNEMFEIFDNEIFKNLNPCEPNMNQFIMQSTDNLSNLNEDIVSSDYETANVCNKPEIPSVDFNQISPTLVSIQETEEDLTNHKNEDEFILEDISCVKTNENLKNNKEKRGNNNKHPYKEIPTDNLEKNKETRGNSIEHPNKEMPTENLKKKNEKRKNRKKHTNKETPTENLEKNKEKRGNSNEQSNEEMPTLYYSYDNSSPLSFTTQNILENMFKYESFPSSTNMGRLAKLLGTHWKNVCNWFVARRNLNKKNGILPRNQLLTNCQYCPNAIEIGKNKAIVHLLTKDHVENMIAAISKHNHIFSHIHQNILGRDENVETEVKKSTDPLQVNNKEDKTQNINKEKDENNMQTLGKVVPFSFKDNSNLSNIILSSVDENEIKPNNDKNIKTAEESKHTKVSVENLEAINQIKKSSKYVGNFDLEILKEKKEHCKSTESDTSLAKLRESSPKINNSLKVNFDSEIVVGYRCPDCLKIFSTEWMLIRHSLLHKKFICSECSEVFTKEEQLKLHFREHLIDSMDDDLYNFYLCLKCYNLSCICSPETNGIQHFRDKHYIRPQRAKRSTPFRSMPHSGVNDHLKVTLEEFWSQYKNKDSNSLGDGESNKLNFVDEGKSSSRGDSKNIKKDNRKIYSAPTYTNITTFNCYMCESFFFTHDELEDHITVHRIQANNKRRKMFQGKEQDEQTKEAKIEDSSSILQHSLCFYCNKSFKTENLLIKHFKFFCKFIPSTLKSKPNSKIYLDRVGKSNKFKFKIQEYSTEYKSQLKSLTNLKCEFCQAELSPEKMECHKRICVSLADKKHSESHKPETIEQITDPKCLENRKNIDYYYLCSFCDVPLESPKLILLHIRGSCNLVPIEIVKKMDSYLSHRLTDTDKNKYYKKIRRTDFNKIFTFNKIQLILNMASFLPVQRHYKRVKCKFCEKCILKTCLKLHLIKQCKYVPKELSYLMVVHGKKLFKTHKNIKNKSLIKTDTLSDKPPFDGVAKDSKLINQNQENLVIENCDKEFSSITSSNILYDCHLCEKKIKISKDFINHMRDSHCMNICEKSCYKWLLKVDRDENYFDLNKISSKNLKDQQEEEENLMTYESVSSEIIDESVMEKDLNEEITVASLADVNDKTFSNAPLPATPNKSQKLDDELFSDDFEQFGNFIETVQIEDSAFKSVSS